MLLDILKSNLSTLFYALLTGLMMFSWVCIKEVERSEVSHKKKVMVKVLATPLFTIPFFLCFESLFEYELFERVERISHFLSMFLSVSLSIGSLSIEKWFFRFFGEIGEIVHQIAVRFLSKVNENIDGLFYAAFPFLKKNEVLSDSINLLKQVKDLKESLKGF